MTSQTTVVVVDDHRLFRAGVIAELTDSVDIVGDAATPTEALALIFDLRPEVVLVDVHMPDGGGHRVVTEALAQLGEAAPKFLAVSVSDASQDVIELVRAGARGYVTKDVATDDLIDAIERVRAGDAYFSPMLAGFVLDALSPRSISTANPSPPNELDELTPREREVMRWLARGYSYKEIATELFISVKTVESHASAVLRKLQLASRNELTRWAADNSLL